MANELDELMDKLDLTDAELDKIIKVQRMARQNFEAGVKPKKGNADGPVKIDLVELGLAPAKVIGTLRRI